MPRGRIASKADEESEPQPLAGMPECPSWLGKMAREMWNELVRTIGPTGMITQADANTMAMYCETFETYQEALSNLKKSNQHTGKVLTGVNGGKYQNPWMPIAVQAKADLMRLGKMLGTDPLSRKKMKVNVKPQLADDPKARFFKARESAG